MFPHPSEPTMSVLAGRYRILRPLGAGGMAEVVAAHDLRLGRDVAIKLIRPALLADPTSRERLLREARAAGALHHPHTVAVYDVGEDDDRPFVVMELVEGESLQDRLQRQGPLAVEETRRIGAAVLDALAAAHASGLVHRDVKPSNILLSASGGVKLADFGIAKALTASDTSLTGTGQLLGTPRYLAPEVAAGRPATPASDLYSLGTVLYECLTGRPPVDGPTPIAVALAHQRAVIPPVRETAPHVPAAIAATVDRALRKEPRQRFATAAAMRAALEGVVPPDVDAPAARTDVPTDRTDAATEHLVLAGAAAPGTTRPLPADAGTSGSTAPPADAGTSGSTTAVADGDASGSTALLAGGGGSVPPIAPLPGPASAGPAAPPRAGDTDADATDADATDTRAAAGGTPPPRWSRRRWAMAGLALVAGIAVLAVLLGGVFDGLFDRDAGLTADAGDVGTETPADAGDQPTDDGGPPAHGVEEPPGQADEGPPGHADDDPADAADAADAAPPETLDDLIAMLARDPDAAGHQGDKLLKELMDLREADHDDRAEDARKLISEIGSWLADDRLAPEVARQAVDVLEPIGRPADPALAGVSALFAEVALEHPAWGEKGTDLRDDLQSLLAEDDPADRVEDAIDLIEKIDEWIAKGELDADRGRYAQEILTRFVDAALGG